MPTYAVEDMWWTDHQNLCSLLRWLDERSEMPDVYEYLGTPWSWTPEWEVMTGKRPDPELAEDGDENDADLTPLLQASLAVERGRRARP